MGSLAATSVIGRFEFFVVRDRRGVFRLRILSQEIDVKAVTYVICLRAAGTTRKRKVLLCSVSLLFHCCRRLLFLCACTARPYSFPDPIADGVEGFTPSRAAAGMLLWSWWGLLPGCCCIGAPAVVKPACARSGLKLSTSWLSLENLLGHPVISPAALKSRCIANVTYQQVDSGHPILDVPARNTRIITFIRDFYPAGRDDT